jgi:hypothetical protein
MKSTKLLYFTRVAYTYEGKPRRAFVFLVAADDDEAAREIERRLPVILPLIEKIEYEPPVLCPSGHHTVAWAADKIDNFGSALATTLELSDNNKKSMSIEEARELAALTDRIVSNMKAIDRTAWNEESLAQFDGTSGSIVANLETIDQSPWNEDSLKEFSQTVAGIVNGLEELDKSEWNEDTLTEFSKTLRGVVDGLEEIEEKRKSAKA